MTHHHGILLYDSTEDLVRRFAELHRLHAAPDDVVVLGCRDRHREAIAAALRGRVVSLVERPDARSRPVVAIAAHRRLVSRTTLPAGARIIMLTEPEHGATTREWTQWRRFEAGCNLALAPYPITEMCAYDTRTIPDAVLAAIGESHHSFFNANGFISNGGVRDPAVVLAGLSDQRRDRPEDAPVFSFASSSLNDLRWVRNEVAAALAFLPALLRADFVVAVNEVLTNAHQHGAGPVDIAMWVSPVQVECRITDRGGGFNDAVAGYHPSRAAAGLWLVRQTCDDLDMWRDAGTFTVRLVSAVAARSLTRPGGAVARAEAAHGRLQATLHRIGRRWGRT